MNTNIKELTNSLKVIEDAILKAADYKNYSDETPDVKTVEEYIDYVRKTTDELDEPVFTDEEVEALNKAIDKVDELTKDKSFMKAPETQQVLKQFVYNIYHVFEKTLNMSDCEYVNNLRYLDGIADVLQCYDSYNPTIMIIIDYRTMIRIDLLVDDIVNKINPLWLVGNLYNEQLNLLDAINYLEYRNM